MINDDTFNKEDIVDEVSSSAAGWELPGHEAVVVWAVDSTLAYVIEWLKNTGHSAKADILESLGDF